MIRCFLEKSTVLFDYVLYDVCYVFKVLEIYVKLYERMLVFHMIFGDMFKEHMVY